MTVPATLTALAIETTKNNNNSIDSNKYKTEGKLISAITKRPTERHILNPQQSVNGTDTNLIRTVPTFRIPKIERSKVSLSSPDSGHSSPTSVEMETNNSISSPPREPNDDSNSQPGKRKFSLNQYKEHKRLKSNDNVQNSSVDVDMRMDTMENTKNSSPLHAQVNSSSISNNQSITSPKGNDKSRDVAIKSNLSEPGVKKLIKKKNDSEVTDIHTFARHCATNISIAQIEKLLERDLRKQRGLQEMNSSDNNDRQNLPLLPTLIRILLPDTITIPIVKSQERLVQEEREKNVLQAFFIRPFLPDSPSEPNGELLANSSIERNEPKSIPLDDNTSSSVSNSVLPVNNDDVNSTSTNVSAALATPTPPVSVSLSATTSFDNIISPEVAQILAQAKGNLTSATTSHLPPTIVNTPTNLPVLPIPNVAMTSSLLSALLNVTQLNGIEINKVPPTNSISNPVLNLPLNFNLPPPTNLSINQLLANAISFGLLPPTTFNQPMFQQPSSTFAMQSSSPVTTTTIHSNPNLHMKSPATPFFSVPDQRLSRFNNHNESQIKNFRGNNRGHNYRRGLHNNNNNKTRRNYYPNRNNNN